MTRFPPGSDMHSQRRADLRFVLGVVIALLVLAGFILGIRLAA
jgi:hypothetical protein